MNAIPHVTNGVSGRRFPTPFSYPIGPGRSPAVVKVFWGSLNLVLAYLLLVRVGMFDCHRTPDMLATSIGGLLVAVTLSRTFTDREDEK